MFLFDSDCRKWLINKAGSDITLKPLQIRPRPRFGHAHCTVLSSVSFALARLFCILTQTPCSPVTFQRWPSVEA